MMLHQKDLERPVHLPSLLMGSMVFSATFLLCSLELLLADLPLPNMTETWRNSSELSVESSALYVCAGVSTKTRVCAAHGRLQRRHTVARRADRTAVEWTVIPFPHV